MATKRMDLGEFVGKLIAEDDVDVLREGVRVLAQALMDAEVSSQIGAGRFDGARRAPPTATAIAQGAGTRGSARSSSGSPKSCPGAPSPDFWSRAGGPSASSPRSSTRPT